MFGARRLNNLRIRTPCRKSWEEMSGDNRTRFCDSCAKTVHDLSRYTRKEAARLMRDSEGGLCARICHDSKGNVVFRPEAGAMGKLIGLSLLSASALAAQNTGSCKLQVKVQDPSGAPVPGAIVSIATIRQATGADGLASMPLSPGKYDIRVESPGFQSLTLSEVKVNCDTDAPVVAGVELRVGTTGGVVVSHASLLRRLFKLR
jgi:hypothetical protein